MKNFSSIHVGHSAGIDAKVIIGIGEEAASGSLSEATSLITYLKSICRKIKRQSWRDNREN